MLAATELPARSLPMCSHGRVLDVTGSGYLCPHCPITPDGRSTNDLYAESTSKLLADILQEAIRKLEGLPPGHANWARMLFMIGKGWQRYELSEADASALESFLRQLRFPRR